jgi:predicted dehydrogenase
MLGEVHHIRAQWHRNNTKPKPADKRDPNDRDDLYNDSWRKSIAPEDRAALGSQDLGRYGYQASSANTHTALEELVRWRLYNDTGGGLMAELGSHQLDACSIFLGKVRPIAVTGVGGKYFYHDDRETDDHVFCTFEFPGKKHPLVDRSSNADPNDIVIVTYSSINTNAFEPYGECVMGTKGTLVMSEEQRAMLYLSDSASQRGTSVTVNTPASGAPVLAASASELPQAAAQAQALGQNALGTGAPSRGYREEMEHFAYLIRMREQATANDRANLKPRCDGPAAMADAIMALVANKAMHTRTRIEFDPSWYDDDLTHVPDDPNRPPRTLPAP